MNKQFLFENEHLQWQVTVIATLLWLWFIWKEWKQPISTIFYLHCSIALFGIGALAMLALKPLSEQTIHSQEAILLTEKFSKVKLDSLKATKTAIKTFNYSPNTSVEEMLDSLGTIYVLGNGISTFDFWQFKDHNLHYLGGDSLSGITQLKYNIQNSLGDGLVLRGTYQYATKNHLLVLEDGQGLGFDSVPLTSSNLQDFKLKTTVNAPGKFVYQLVEKDSLGNKIKTEPVPFLVSEPSKIKVLFINTFPTFESKYLKNHLAEMGHQIVAKNQITKRRFKFEYFNTDKIPINSLTKATLAEFDLLILDADSYTNASQKRRNIIHKAIKDEGLGVFIQPDADFIRNYKKASFLNFMPSAKTKAKWNDFSNTGFDTYPYSISKTLGVEKIHASDKAIFTAYKRMQKGRIATTVIHSSYQQKLKGSTVKYKQFWNSIINTIAKKKEAPVKWEFITSFPVVDEPLEFNLQSSEEIPFVQNNQGYQIALKQNIEIPTLWTGVTYPVKNKWNQIISSSVKQPSQEYYVFDSTNWKTLRDTKLQAANARQFKETSIFPLENEITKPINNLWFFGIVLLAFGYLWIHPKLF